MAALEGWWTQAVNAVGAIMAGVLMLASWEGGWKSVCGLEAREARMPVRRAVLRFPGVG